MYWSFRNWFQMKGKSCKKCGRCKQASRTASHVPCDCEALVTLTFRCLSGHFMQLSDWKHLNQQDITLCSRCRAARWRNVRAARSMRYGWSVWVTNVASLLVLMSCPFYSYCDFYVWFRPFLFINISSGTQLGVHNTTSVLYIHNFPIYSNYCIFTISRLPQWYEINVLYLCFICYCICCQLHTAFILMALYGDKISYCDV